MTSYIYEKTNIIPIKNTPPTKSINYNNEYGLIQQTFDPLNNSPPNNFLIKLQYRFHLYNNNSSNSTNTNIFTEEIYQSSLVINQ
jgi:hypothetical protein